MLVDVARGGRPAQLLAERLQEAEQLLARRETARHEPGCALGRVPRAEMLDHRLRMDGRLRVRGELAHRGRAPEPLGAGDDLRHDLLVRVALADSGLELRELLRIDRGERPIAGLLGHVNNCRAGWTIRN